MYICDVCDESFEDKESMSDHIESEHYQHCDMCTESFKKKSQLELHINFAHEIRQEHLMKETSSQTDINDSLEDELKNVKRNFSRLQGMYQEVNESIDKLKNEHTIKILEFEDKLEAEKKENETLRERNDILFKLGGEYIQRHENKKKTDCESKNLEEENPKNPTNEDEVMVVVNMPGNKNQAPPKESSHTQTKNNEPTNGPPNHRNETEGSSLASENVNNTNRTTNKVDAANEQSSRTPPSPPLLRLRSACRRWHWARRRSMTRSSRSAPCFLTR